MSTTPPASPDAAPPWVSGEQVRSRVSPDQARRLLREVLEAGFDPAHDPARAAVPAGPGEFLIMPSATPTAAGMKILSVTPDNPARDLPRIQGWYLLWDLDTLAPRVLLDGTALTTLRTPAVSALAADELGPSGTVDLAIIGTGPQSSAHVEAMAQIRDLGRITIVGRDPERTRRCADASAALLGAGPERVESATFGEPAVEAVIRSAGIIVCATSAATPVFDGSWVDDEACVVALGSHDPDRRELDSALMGRSLVVVEDVATALREAGDVVMAVADGALDPAALVPLRDIVIGGARRATDRPNIAKTVGMSWQDLVIAEGAALACGS